MSRRRAAEKRHILPDPVYGSKRIAKFINRVMQSGKKAVAEKIVYQALDELHSKRANVKSDKADGEAKASASVPDLFEDAMSNVRPSVEVRSRRVGGATYQVPVEVRSVRRDALAMRWLIQSAQKRSEKSMAKRLSAELEDALNGRGSAVKKREDVHKMAKANQAFAHFRW